MGQMYLADSLLLLLSSSSSSSSSTFRFTDSIRRSTYVFIDEKEMGKEKCVGVFVAFDEEVIFVLFFQ